MFAASSNITSPAETPQDIAKNVASLGFDIQELSDQKKSFLDYVAVEPSEIQETGDYDLEGLFIRLENAVETVGAKRVMFDTLEALFSSFSNAALLRSEFRRLFRWLKDRDLRPDALGQQRGVELLKRTGFARCQNRRTLKQILQIVITVAVQPTNADLFLRSVQLSIDTPVIGAALCLDAKSAVRP